MRLFRKSLLILVSLMIGAFLRAAGISFPGTASCVSPNQRWQVTYSKDSSEVHVLRVSPIKASGEKVLFTTDRCCEVLWQKSGDLVAVTDWEGSNLSTVWIVDPQRPEAKRDLMTAFPNIHKILLKAEFEGHCYWEALEWESDSILLVRAVGHTDENPSHEFMYKFRLNMNQGTYRVLEKQNAPGNRAEEEAWKSKEKAR